jgi:YHS domain-containing protein
MNWLAQLLNVGGHGGHWGGATENQGPFAGAGSEKAIDPVSGREVLTARALTAAYQGRIFYFDSPDNRQRFEAAPEQYARHAAPAPQQERHRGCC